MINRHTVKQIGPHHSAERADESRHGDQMKVASRCGSVGILILSIFLGAFWSASEAQQSPKMHRVGVLRPDSALAVDSVSPNPSVEMFQQAMRDLGYVEGRNVLIEYRYADGKVDRLPKLAEELVRLNVDVIWAFGPAVPHARKATKTIPIVISNVGDPVGLGFAASLAKPGGHVTGFSSYSPELSGNDWSF
jgi:putative ABC transport system substrate-binding protein